MIETESGDGSTYSDLQSTSTTSEVIPVDIANGIHDKPVQPVNHHFPSTYFGNKYRSFNPQWFQKHVWLEYSILKDSVYCYPCCFFAMGSHRVEECFVTTGYCDWKHATGKTGGFIKHEMSLKHKHSIASWSDFKANQSSNTSIACTLDNVRRELVMKNRYYLKTIIEVLLFCASQEIALRGHREVNAKNRGNFLELLELVAKHDPAVSAHLKDGPRNAVYTSHNIQNELLHILANRVRKIICQGVMDAGFFSILCDETRDAGKQEQMSFVVRYVDTSGSIHEHFLRFTHAKGLNAESLSAYIKDILATCDFDCSKLVSQGYDGASVMSGRCNGVQKRVREFAPCAAYIHCYAHVLNLVLVDSVKSITTATDFFTLMEALYVFVSTSKVHVVFIEKQLSLHPSKQPLELQKLSDTRWVCRYAAVNAICCTYDALLLTIEEVAESSDSSKAIEARGLYHQVKAFSFIVSLVVFDRILSCTKHLSDQLQSSTIDLSIAADLVAATKSTLSDFRSIDYWSKVYKYATQIAQLHSVDIQPMSRQRKRPARLSESVLLESTGSRESLSNSEELRINSVIDKFLQELNDRFNNSNILIMKGIAACTPSSSTFLCYEDLELLAKEYNIQTDALQVEVSLVSNALTNKPEINSLANFRNYLYSSQPAYSYLFS